MKELQIIVGEGTEYPLKGILTLPDNTEHPVPGAVFVHGSGSSDMNEHIGGLYPFRDLAHALAEKGIASIRYDKRSFAHGRKMLKNIHPVTVYEETIEDAVFAADLLRADPRIDKDNVFIIGHSMGAMLAPRIDDEGGSFKGIIMMAGSPYKLEEILERQLGELTANSKGLKARIITKQAAKIKESFSSLYEMDIEETKKKKMAGGTTLYYFREMGEHPVMSYLEKTDKPVLIMQGDKDFQCRADVDYKAFEDALKDRDNVTFHLYPGLNHVFVVSLGYDDAKAMKEYGPKRQIPSDVSDDIAAWIHKNA